MTQEKDPLLELFDADPMAHREFLDIHDEISTPWFRLLLFLGTLYRWRVTQRYCLFLVGSPGPDKASETTNEAFR